MKQRIGAIIVTHNSDEVIHKCVDSIQQQSHPVDEIIIVDSGSNDLGYLDSINEQSRVKVIETDNIGFGRCNNLGIKYLDRQIDIVVFLNPDTFLFPNFFEKMIEKFLSHGDVGILSGKLLCYDLQKKGPDGRIDSCGIFRKWYGRWYDRGQGAVDVGQYDTKKYVPALCGALLCCRVRVLRQFSGVLFDPDFFMYKEDVELGIRMRKLGHKLLYHPELIAYHCRGWQKSRKKMALEIKKIASLNEILLYKKHPSPYLLWALFKYSLVSVFKI